MVKEHLENKHTKITNTNVSLSILDLFVLHPLGIFLEYWLIDECWLIDWWIINWFPWWASWIWNFQLLSKDSPHALQAKHGRILRVSAEFPKRAGLLSLQVQSSYSTFHAYLYTQDFDWFWHPIFLSPHRSIISFLLSSPILEY